MRTRASTGGVGVLAAALLVPTVGALPAAAAGTSLMILPVSVKEGNSGGTTATFAVVRGGDTSGVSSVKWRAGDSADCMVAPGACTAAPNTDFVPVPLTTLDFAANETRKTVSVTVNGDTGYEENETFVVRLSGAVGAYLAMSSAKGTITNDDAGFNVSDAAVVEGNSGQKLATFTVSRIGDVSGTSSVRWRTVDGEATAGSGDYLAAAPTTPLTFGVEVKSTTVSVVVKGDTKAETSERFQVQLFDPVQAAVVRGSGSGEITDDDAVMSINDASVTEGGIMKFTVTRTGAGVQAGASSVKVNTGWQTGIDYANPNNDFYLLSAPLTLSFTAGQTSKSVSVQTRGDTVREQSEKFQAFLINPVGGSIGDSSADGTIIDND